MKKISLEEDKNQENSENLEQDSNKSTKLKPPKLNATIIAISIAVVAGLASGALVAKNRLSSQSGQEQSADTQAPSSQKDVKIGKVYGSQDTETFKDTAEGIVQKGGIDGEGSHHLVRPGGPGKNVYLTSSIIDLDLFVGHKAKVWGETFNAKKAGWLMDIGRVKPTELNASLPSE